MKRAHDKKAARNITLPFFRKEIEEKALARLAGVSGTDGSLRGCSPRPVMRFEVSPEKPGSLILEIAAGTLLADNNQLLQITFFYLEGACEAVGYKVTLHYSDGQLRATGKESRRLLNGVALLKDSGVSLPVSAIEGDGSSHVRVELDDLPEAFARSLKGEGVAVDASVFVHNHSNVYWRRDEPASLIMDEAAVGILWLIRSSWNNLLVAFSSSDFTIASNDPALLEELRVLFPGLHMNSAVISSKVGLVCATAQKDGLDLYSIAVPNGGVKLGLSRAAAIELVSQLARKS